MSQQNLAVSENEWIEGMGQGKDKMSNIFSKRKIEHCSLTRPVLSPECSRSGNPGFVRCSVGRRVDRESLPIPEPTANMIFWFFPLNAEQ